MTNGISPSQSIPFANIDFTVNRPGRYIVDVDQFGNYNVCDSNYIHIKYCEKRGANYGPINN